jgi:hypothetical protein
MSSVTASSVTASSVTASVATARLSAEDAWQQLRMPFVLPVAARGLQVCQWELIDMDCAGCTSCGGVHRCSAGTCTDDETTEDALGMCRKFLPAVCHTEEGCDGRLIRTWR